MGGWLYFDAWSNRHHASELAKWVGFFLLATSFLVTSATWGEPGILQLVATALRLLGYGGVVVGNILDPIQPRPKTSGLEGETGSAALLPFSLGSLMSSLQWAAVALPVGALAIAGLYWRRATTGLERHIKPLAYAFVVFAVSDGLALASLWRSSTNPLLQPWVAPLGPLWIAEHVTLTAAAAVLMSWVWRYLTKRLLSQLFIMATSLTVAIVLVSTVGITALLLTNLQKDSLDNLDTAAKVLSYAIDSKTAETRSNAEILAQNPAVVTAIGAHDHTALTQISGGLLTSKHLTDAIITGDSGQVLVRASDPDRYGDSLSDDSLVKRALTGTAASSTASRSGVLAPTLIITTAQPIRGAQNAIVGVALTSLALDNAFVDGIKHTTGLDSTIYSGQVRVATTLTAAGGTSRSIGAKETNSGVIATTLHQGKTWLGPLTVANQDFLAVYLPLKDVDNTVVGMLFVGQPQTTLLQTAEAAVKLTFASAALMLLILILPIYLTSRQIVRQLH
ncbi:MAG TPA: cache domain-containing protein [Candidatus Saccharimonadia bacterium]|nr:cache domain-containing protein [Candidatus Saccharimonadia bacterium]